MAAAQSVVITPEQQTVIQEYVTTQEVAPVAPPEVSVEVGTVLPETIEVYPIDAPDAQVQYHYVVLDGQMLLVEPETREIVHIIQ